MRSEIVWDGPFGREPDDLPVLVATTRQRGVEGKEFRLADDPEGTIVRLSRRSATIVTELGRIRLDATELVGLAPVCAAWREHRRNWSALIGGWIRHQPWPRRYRSCEWSAVSVMRLENIVDETAYRTSLPSSDESIGGLPVELHLEDGLAHRVGAVVRTEIGRCVTMVRGSIAVSARWPESAASFGAVAQYLIRRSYPKRPGEVGPLRHLHPDAVELTTLGCAVVAEAAVVAAELVLGG